MPPEWLVGAWRLVSSEVRYTEGAVEPRGPTDVRMLPNVHMDALFEARPRRLRKRS